MQKRVDCDSFNYGTDLPLVHIADDKDVLRKTASSSVVDQWGDIEPIKGHTLIHLTALGDYETTGFNHNADGFRAAFCKKAHPTFIKNGALYRNHKAEKGKEEGYVVKTAHNDNMGRTELLVAANHNKCADWLSDIEANRPVKFSMGFNCTAPGDECSICGHMAANRKHYCEHTKKGAAAPYGMGRILPDGRKVGVFNDHGYWNDISRVPVGADAIAMDLRKIASFQPDEVIGGAEMAELYNMKLAAPDIDREILAHKISNIEKRVDMAGFATPFIPSGKQRKMSKVDVDALRNAKVAAMFGQLSKTGAVLPMEDFYSLIMGEDYEANKDLFVKAASWSRKVFSVVCSDPDRLNAVCANTTYDPDRLAHDVLNNSSCRKIAEDYSLDIDKVSMEELRKTASGHRVEPAVRDERIDFLIDQYASYKLATILSLPVEPTDALLFAATIG